MRERKKERDIERERERERAVKNESNKLQSRANSWWPKNNEGVWEKRGLTWNFKFEKLKENQKREKQKEEREGAGKDRKHGTLKKERVEIPIEKDWIC